MLSGSYWDVSPDSKRFLIPVNLADSAGMPLSVAVNWYVALKK